MPVDPYSQMAFVEILNILLTAGHIVDVNRFLINRNANPLFGSLSGYFRWSFSDNHFTLWQRVEYNSPLCFSRRMSHQVITRMAYNAKTKQIETWQHSNNVWPTTDHFYALDVKTDEQMFEFITLIANGLWQGRKWRKAFKTLFEEYPELVRSSYEHELRGQPWKAYCAICKKYEELAQSKCNEIVARFRQLTGIV